MITIVKMNGKQELDSQMHTQTQNIQPIKKRNTQNWTNSVSAMYANKKAIERCLSPP